MNKSTLRTGFLGLVLLTSLTALADGNERPTIPAELYMRGKDGCVRMGPQVRAALPSKASKFALSNPQAGVFVVDVDAEDRRVAYVFSSFAACAAFKEPQGGEEPRFPRGKNLCKFIDEFFDSEPPQSIASRARARLSSKEREGMCQETDVLFSRPSKDVARRIGDLLKAINDAGNSAPAGSVARVRVWGYLYQFAFGEDLREVLRR